MNSDTENDEERNLNLSEERETSSEIHVEASFERLNCINFF